MRAILVAASIALALWTDSAMASQEGTLLISRFRLESPAGPLGPVVAFGTQSREGLISLNVEAFGKSYSLTPKQLEKLHGFNANGLQLSQISSGYFSPGGRVYLIFTMGFMQGEPERRFVVIRPDGKIGVGTSP